MNKKSTLANKSSRNLKTLAGEVTVLFLISFILNLFWELAQMGLYEPMAVYPWCCFEATFWDAIIISAVYLLMSRANRMTIVLLMLFVAAYIEERAMLESRWIYSEAMPLVFGLGLSPLIQLPATTILSFWILKRLLK